MKYSRLVILSIAFSFGFAFGLEEIPAGTSGTYTCGKKDEVYVVMGNCPNLNIVITKSGITLKGNNNNQYEVRSILVEEQAGDIDLMYLSLNDPSKTRTLVELKDFTPSEGKGTVTITRLKTNGGMIAFDNWGNRYFNFDGSSMEDTEIDIPAYVGIYHGEQWTPKGPGRNAILEDVEIYNSGEDGFTEYSSVREYGVQLQRTTVWECGDDGVESGGTQEIETAEFYSRKNMWGMYLWDTENTTLSTGELKDSEACDLYEVNNVNLQIADDFEIPNPCQ